MDPKPPLERQHYQQEAEVIRAKAHGTRDPEARAQLLVIALLYDRLAEHLLVALQTAHPDDSPSDALR